MKKTVKASIAILSLTALTGLAHAANPGAYAGLGLGWSKQEGSNPYQSLYGYNLSKKNQDTGLGGRVFGGYNINQNFGIEAGFAKYADASYKGNYTEAGYASNQKTNFDMYALDVVGKAYLPISNSGFNVYGLAGLALVHSKSSKSISTTYSGISTGRVLSQSDESSSKTLNKIRPIYGIGASYDIPKTQLTTALEMTRIQGYGNVKTSKSAIPSADLVTLNISYNFG